MGAERFQLVRRVVPWLMTAVAIAVFLAEAWPLRPALDDSYIYFRYAENFAQGHGLVYNEGERVEGNTNLLWTLLIAGGVRLGFGAPETAHVLDLSAGVAALLATFGLTRALLPASFSWVAGFAPGLVLSCASFTFWSTAGLGTTLFMALVTGALAAQASARMGLATVAVFAATLARPEGALAAAVIFGFHLLWRRREGWTAWRLPALYALGILVLTGFRMAYYGSPVPNTFYTKVGGIPIANGVRYLEDFLRGGAGPLVLLAVPALFRGQKAWPAATLAILTAAYVVAIGGGAFPLWRFLLPTLPWLVGLALCSALIAFDVRRWLGGLMVVGLVGTFGNFVFGHSVAGWKAPFPTARTERLSELWLGQCAFHKMTSLMGLTVKDRADRGEPIELVAAGAIGAVGYYSELPILDLFGLVDAKIAKNRDPLPKYVGRVPGHIRSDPDYVMSRAPDYIMMDPPGRRARSNVVHGLRSHPDFQNEYELVEDWGLFRRRGLPPPIGPPRLIRSIPERCEP